MLDRCQLLDVRNSGLRRYTRDTYKGTQQQLALLWGFTLGAQDFDGVTWRCPHKSVAEVDGADPLGVSAVSPT